MKALSPTVPTSWRCLLSIVLWSKLRVGGTLEVCGVGPRAREVLQEALHWHHRLKGGHVEWP